MMKVPFVDLKAQYASIKSEIDDAIARVIDKTAFIGGEYVREFENSYAQAYGVRHCISVGNGTDALYVVLKALGIAAGDEVITVANSWISTSETITQAGGTPVFVDIEPDFYTIAVERIEARITSRTKAIVPVHLYGQPAAIEDIKKICERHQLHLVEDCAQAHFSEYNGQRVGTFGIAGTFSFYPGKNLGAYGDGGAIITNDDALATKMRAFANHGALRKHEHFMEGINSRLDGLQAAILLAKLPHIYEWNEKRRQHARLYDQLLSEVDEVASPKVREAAKHIFHLYVIRTPKRQALQAFLRERGIETAIHYPTALPLLPAYQYLGYVPDAIPVAADYQRQILSLPMYPELAPDQISFVVSQIKEGLARS